MKIYLVGSTSITKAHAMNAVGYRYRLTGYYWLTPPLSLQRFDAAARYG